MSCGRNAPGSRLDGDSQAKMDELATHGTAGSERQANALSRAAGLASAALRLAYTFSEGAAEGLHNACCHLYQLLPPAVRQKTDEEPYPADLTGKVAIVTGGNAGIGFATAQQLARRGAHVVLACRDKGRAEAAAQAIAGTPPLPGCCGSSSSSSSAPAPASSNQRDQRPSSAPAPAPAPAPALPAQPSADAAADTHIHTQAQAQTQTQTQTQTQAQTSSLPPAAGAAAAAAAAAAGGAGGPPSSSLSPAAAAAAAAASSAGGGGVPALRVDVMELDLGRLSSVRRFAEEWRRRGLPLHLLVCNAGVMAPPERTMTADGLEVQFQVNFLSHWLLTHLLLDHERERRGKEGPAAAKAKAAEKAAAAAGGGGGTRVVVVSSVVHRAGLLQWGDLLSERSYEPYITYGASKLAAVIFAKELQRRLDRHPEYGLYDSVVAIHPGIVRTHLANSFFRSYGLSWAVGTPLEPLQRLRQRLWDSVGHVLLATTDQAARRMLTACLGPAEQLAGRYMALGRVYTADKASDDPALAAELWATATRLTSYSPPPSLA
ncbi:hypothetical protein PLESTB_000015000 [Pleodorina starrii]|uniref:Uncharacterized protein n=1 Tax=Pleodorina starrii TaxID=330485 RepID=A0A9W6EWL1_9CHLO|nr:hypothetical protein PLESTM_001119600 [Pleodorina starrii]GLC47684.1 hypothetical protein PLESTB_000015000 [Pleodorina starrii]GLC70905.1 hypothetical protein PLESTF_001045300 [Pleodorina starrii]